MKPYQIGLLLAAAAFGGALVMRYAGRPAPQPAPIADSAPAPELGLPLPPQEPAPPSAFPEEKRSTLPRAKPSPVSRKAADVPPSAQQSSPQAVAPAAPAPEPAAPAPAVAQLDPEPPLAPPPPPRTVTIPAGAQISVRLDFALGSDRNDTGDSFTATLEAPLVVDGYVIAEKGARADGQVVRSDPGGRVRGVSSLAIELTRIRTSDGQRLNIQTEPFEKLGEGSVKQDAAKVGAAAGIGAAIGAIAGGGKGAAIGAAIGGASGAGGVLATRGKPATLPSETRISFRLRDAVSVTEKR